MRNVVATILAYVNVKQLTRYMAEALIQDLGN
jgi:hypothetical protein